MWCGSMCDVGACVMWEHVWCGSMCGVGACVSESVSYHC